MIDLLQKSSAMCDDIAWGWILTLFGSEGSGCTSLIGGLPTADINSPYANAFAVLTASLAFLGSLFIAYHVVIGIVSSAYTGKVLGERWHQIWAPLRVVFGFGMLIPMGDGFSAVHYLLRDVVGLAAVNLGNAAVHAFVVNQFDPTTDYVKAKISTKSGEDVANKFFAAEVCTGVINASDYNLFTDFFYNAQSPANGQPTSSDTENSNWEFGSCGTITLPNVKIDGADGGLTLEDMRDNVDGFNKDRIDATVELADSIHKLMDYEALGEFLNTNASTVETSNDALIQKLRTDGVIGAGIQDQINRIVKTWNDEVGEAASDVFELASRGGRSGALADITKYGFMAAGTYERTLSSMASFTNTMVTTGATSTTIDVDEAMVRKIHKAAMIIGSSKAIDNNDNAGQDNSAESNSGIKDKILRTVLPTSLMGAYYSGTTSLDPVGDMIVFGNQLLTWTGYVIAFFIFLKVGGFVGGILGAFAGSGVASPATGIAGVVVGSAFSSLAGAIIPWIAPAIIGMILIGLMHSFVLPMIPFIMVFIMGISWLLMFLEGAIAGVLWAFVFIRMDGNEFADQKQSPGIALLFNLLLRPALGMLAFAGMILLLPALLNGLMAIWAMGFVMQTGDSQGLTIVSIYQFLAQAVIFAWMQWTITLRLASLIPSIADRVGHWMGISSTSGYSDGMETGATIAGAIAATHAVSSGVKGTVASAMKGKDPNKQSAGQKIAQIREARANEQANNK